MIEHPECGGLLLKGRGAPLATLAMLLRAPRSVADLQDALREAHPGTGEGDLVGYLINEQVLVPFNLMTQLAELHQRTTQGGEGPAISPALETERRLRECVGGRAMTLTSPVPAPGLLTEALSLRRTARSFSGEPLKHEQISSLLAMACGMGLENRGEPPAPMVAGGPPGRRTYPSAGALYMVETLVYPARAEGIETQFYYYQPLAHRLVAAAPTQSPDEMSRLLCDHPIEHASLLIMLFLDFTRISLSKYGEKAYRLGLLEAGHIAQNVVLLAAAWDLAALPICGFRDEELSGCAGLRYPYQAIVYVLAVGGQSGTS